VLIYYKLCITFTTQYVVLQYLKWFETRFEQGVFLHFECPDSVRAAFGVICKAHVQNN